VESLEVGGIWVVGLVVKKLSKLCALGYVELNRWLDVLLELFWGLSCQLPLNVPGRPIVEVILAILLSESLVVLRVLLVDCFGEGLNLSFLACPLQLVLTILQLRPLVF
jgi:hypothetical protein